MVFLALSPIVLLFGLCIVINAKDRDGRDLGWSLLIALLIVPLALLLVWLIKWFEKN